MATAEELTSFVNQNLNCFAVENHQGKRGPEMLEATPVDVGDVDTDSYNAAQTRDDQIAVLNHAVESAWLARGDHAGINIEWINTCSGDSCNLPTLPNEIMAEDVDVE